MQMLQTSRKSQQGPTILLLKWGEKGAFNSKGGDRSPNTAARSPGSCDRKPGGPAQRWGAQPPSGSQQESESHRDRGPGGLGQTINQCWLTLKNGRNANSKSPRHVSAFVDTSFLLLKPSFLWVQVVWTEDRTLGSVSTGTSGRLDPVLPQGQCTSGGGWRDGPLMSDHDDEQALLWGHAF